MRVPISIQTEPFDVNEVQGQVAACRDAFLHYLDDVPRKSTRSKHGLMGPVGKILGEVKSGRRDGASLKGYAVRVHEATGRSPSPTGLAALERGVDILVSLLAQAPITTHDRILDRIDYGLYYDLRKKEAESKESRRLAWIEFLRAKYGDGGGLSEAWADDIILEDLYLPRKAEGSKSRRATVKQQDIAAFWESQGATAIVEEEEEE